MRFYLKYLTLPLKSKFVSNTAILAMGTAIAQGITFIVTPILTRLYSPEQFGVLSLYMVVFSIASIGSCFSYEPSIMLPEDETEAMKLLIACLGLTIIMAGLSCIIFLLIKSKLTYFFHGADLNAMVLWIPLTFFTVGVFQSFNYWNTRNKRFMNLFASKIWQVGATAAVQAGGGIMIGAGTNILIWGQILGQFVGSFVLAYDTIKSKLKLIGNTLLKPFELTPLLRRYKNFPLYSSWGSLMNMAAFQCVPILFFNFFGPAAAGFYFLSSRLVGIPMSLAGNAVGQVLFQRTSEEIAQGHSISKLVSKVIGHSILIWVPFFLILSLIAPTAFSIFFGAKWKIAGYYVQGFAPLFLLQLITSPVSVILLVLNKQRVVTIIQAFLLSGAVFSLVIAKHISDNPVVSITIYSIVQTLIYLAYLFTIMRYSATSVREVLREIILFRGKN